MAAGCPVIGANKGGIPDIISDGINGCLYDPDEKDNGVQSLIEATKKILETVSYTHLTLPTIRSV